MTLYELSQLFWLKKEVKLNTDRLGEITAKLSAGTSKISDDPAIIRSASDRTGDTASELIMLRDKIEEQKKQCAEEQIRLEGYISSIDDSFTRQIFIYRFVCNMTWGEVARAIGGGNSAEAVKKRCQRWVRSHE